MVAGSSWREEQHQTHRDEKELSNSNSTRRLVLGASSPELKNMAYTNHRYMSKIFQFLQKKLGMSESDSTFSMKAYKKTMFWYGGCSCLRRWKPPSIHLGPKYLTKHELRRDWKSIQCYSEVDDGTFWRNSECKMAFRTRSILSHDQAIKWAKAKVRVYSDSVVCVGQMKDSREATARWVKVKWKDSRCILLTKKQWESTKKQLNSSGIFSQDFRHGLLFKRSKKTWWERTFNPKSSRTGSSSCECSTTLIGRKERMMRNVFRMLRKSRIREKIVAETLDVCRSWIGKGVVWKIFLPSQWRVGLHSQQNGSAFPSNRSPCKKKKNQCSESRNPKEKEG